MSWLNELNKDTIYKYTCECGEEPITISGTKEDLRALFDTEPTFSHGDTIHYQGMDFTYSGFEPRKLGIMTKTVFEKNGRKGIQVTHSNGKQSYRSQSRENYLLGKGTKSVLTKGCQEASNKVKEKMVRQKFDQWTKGSAK